MLKHRLLDTCPELMYRKQLRLFNRIKVVENIVPKRGQAIQYKASKTTKEDIVVEIKDKA